MKNFNMERIKEHLKKYWFRYLVSLCVVLFIVLNVVLSLLKKDVVDRSTIPINNQTSDDYLKDTLLEERYEQLAAEEEEKKRLAAELAAEEEEKKRLAAEEEKKRLAKKNNNQSKKSNNKPVKKQNKPRLTNVEQPIIQTIPYNNNAYNNKRFKRSTREWNNSGIQLQSSTIVADVVEDATKTDAAYSPKRNVLRAVLTGANTGNTDLTHVILKEQVITVILDQAITTAGSDNSMWSGLVRQDVNGYQGNIVLIPQSSRVSGTFDSFDPDRGRLRVNLIRIITPQGDFIIQDGDGYDQDGSIGISGEVDNKYFQRYVIPALVSLSFEMVRALYLDFAYSYLSTNALDSTYAVSAITGILQSTDRVSNAVISDIIRRHLQIKPVITLVRGTHIQMQLLQDVVFAESDEI